MGITICPTARVDAPVDSVWELLSEPTLYDLWWDARMRRIVPEGSAVPGQMLYATASALGFTRDVTLEVKAVDPEQHQVQLQVTLLFGITNHATISAAPIDAATSRVQFG